MPERVPPQDLDAERAMLGSMMMSRDAVADVLPVIPRERSDWLYVPAHRDLFVLLLDLFDANVPIDLMTVSDAIRKSTKREGLEQDYLIRLAESFAEWANAGHYARIVREKGVLRDLISAATWIVDAAYEPAADGSEVTDEAEKRMTSVTERRIESSVTTIGAAARHLVDEYDDAKGRPVGLPCGIESLDQLTGGFHPGNLIVIAGRPSMGKTALGLTMAMAVAFDRGFGSSPVGFLSIEMSQDEVAARLLSAASKVPAAQLRGGRIGEDDRRRLAAASVEFAQAPLYIDDTTSPTLLQLRAGIRRMHRSHAIEIAFVDYLQLVRVPRCENRQVEIATISRGLKAVARELSIPIVVMAQLNRQPEARADKRPQLSDLRESGAIEQDADLVILLHRPDYYKADDRCNEADAIVAKSRNGPTGSVALHFHKQTMRFSTLAMQPAGYVGYANR